MDVIEARIVRDTFIAPAIADPQHAAHDALAHMLAKPSATPGANRSSSRRWARTAADRSHKKHAVSVDSDALALRAGDHFSPFPTEQ